MHFQLPNICFQRVIVTALDNGGIVHKQSGVQDLTQKPNPDPVDMVSSEDFVCEMKCEISRRNVQTLSSTLNAQSKVAQFCLIAWYKHFYTHPGFVFWLVFYILVCFRYRLLAESWPSLRISQLKSMQKMLTMNLQ